MAARVVFLAFIGLTGSIIYNALYLQGQPGPAAVMASGQAVPTPERRPPIEVVTPPPVSTDLPPPQAEAGEAQPLVRAVQRELAARGFNVGPEDGTQSGKTRAAISAYEKAQGLPVTGVATDELLRHILLGGSALPAGATGSVDASTKGKAEAKVKVVQKTLADLGYAPGPVDGAMGTATARAITSFQHDRKIAETGRITPELLRELNRVTGHDPTKTAAEQ